MVSKVGLAPVAVSGGLHETPNNLQLPTVSPSADSAPFKTRQAAGPEEDTAMGTVTSAQNLPTGFPGREVDLVSVIVDGAFVYGQRRVTHVTLQPGVDTMEVYPLGPFRSQTTYPYYHFSMDHDNFKATQRLHLSDDVEVSSAPSKYCMEGLNCNRMNCKMFSLWLARIAAPFTSTGKAEGYH